MIQNLEEKKCIHILSDNYIGHLAFISKGGPYVIPVTYYYDQADHSIISYSEEGHKIDAMRKNPSVSLQVAQIKTVNTWQSVLVHGKYEELKGIDAKYLLHQFSEGIINTIKRKEHKNLQFISEFSSKIHGGGIPIVYRIKIQEITGRQREHKK